jgi:hypothetical protein
MLLSPGTEISAGKDFSFRTFRVAISNADSRDGIAKVFGFGEESAVGFFVRLLEDFKKLC